MKGNYFEFVGSLEGIRSDRTTSKTLYQASFRMESKFYKYERRPYYIGTFVGKLGGILSAILYTLRFILDGYGKFLFREELMKTLFKAQTKSNDLFEQSEGNFYNAEHLKTSLWIKLCFFRCNYGC